jgi:hypothetical protein
MLTNLLFALSSSSLCLLLQPEFTLKVITGSHSFQFHLTWFLLQILFLLSNGDLQVLLLILHQPDCHVLRPDCRFLLIQFLLLILLLLLQTMTVDCYRRIV